MGASTVYARTKRTGARCKISAEAYDVLTCYLLLNSSKKIARALLLANLIPTSTLIFE